jgi:3-oxoacyl-[acyl-carrier protein] reductase
MASIVPANCRGLLGKNALVTGASGGIGRAITKALLENGVRVSAVYNRNRSPLEKLGHEYGHDRINPIKIDFLCSTFREKIKMAVMRAKEWQGSLDILVNTAGIWTVSPFLYENDAERDAMWRINYEAAYHFCKESIKHMMGKGGSIINIASTGGGRGSGQQATYCSTKAALINLTQSLAEEFASRRIRVNAISPGATDTRGFRKYFPAKRDIELRTKSIPLGRLCTPEEVAQTCILVLSNDYLTGGNIELHGGRP